jgi:hypothetical protein
MVMRLASRSVWLDAGIAGVIPVAALLLRFWVVSCTSWFRVESPPNQSLLAEQQVQLPINDAVTLIGYDLFPSVVYRGQELHVRLYWQATRPLDRDYSSFVKLFIAGKQEQEVAKSDHQHPGGIPTTTWTTQRYIVDDHYLSLPADTPPVALSVVMGLYRQDNLEWCGAVQLPELVHVTQTIDLFQVQMSSSPAGYFSDRIRLLGYRVEESRDGLLLTLFWQAIAQPEEDYQVFIHALDGAGNEVAQADGPPVGGLYATSTWLPGQVIVDTHNVPIKAKNIVSLKVGLYSLSTMMRLPVRLDVAPTENRDAVDIPSSSFGGRGIPQKCRSLRGAVFAPKQSPAWQRAGLLRSTLRSSQ